MKLTDLCKSPLEMRGLSDEELYAIKFQDKRFAASRVEIDRRSQIASAKYVIKCWNADIEELKEEIRLMNLEIKKAEKRIARLTSEEGLS